MRRADGAIATMSLHTDDLRRCVESFRQAQRVRHANLDATLDYDAAVSLAVDERDARADELAITQVTPEWCAAETGGVVVLLFLTSVRTPWLPQIEEVIRTAASRHERGRAAVLSVFRLDKRFPLDIGFDENLDDIRESFRRIAPSIGANALVLEFGGFLAWTMKTTVNTLGRVVRTKHPRTIDTTVVSGASWIVNHANPSEVRSVGHYVDAVTRMKRQLGCEPR